MSVAYRCNRCGTFFDVRELVDGPPSRRRGSFDEMVDEAKIAPSDPPVQIRCKPLGEHGDVTPIPFDLCGRCARGFREFLHNGPGG